MGQKKRIKALEAKVEKLEQKLSRRKFVCGVLAGAAAGITIKDEIVQQLSDTFDSPKIHLIHLHAEGDGEIGGEATLAVRLIKT